MKQLLLDVCIYPFQVSESEGGVWVVRGVFGAVDRPTGNRRIYRRELMERELNRVKSLIDNGMLYGEAEHPPDGKTSIPRISHRITKLGINSDGWVIGEAIILNTPYGSIVKEMLKSGGKVGVSSRGFGSVKEDKNGYYIVQDDYELVTFDFVANPSVENALVSDYSIESLNEDLELLDARRKRKSYYMTKLDKDMQEYFNGGDIKSDKLYEVLDYLGARVEKKFEIGIEELKRMILENNKKFREIIAAGNDKIVDVLVQLIESYEREFASLKESYEKFRKANETLYRRIGDIENIDLIIERVSKSLAQVDSLVEALDKVKEEKKKVYSLLEDAVKYVLKLQEVDISEIVFEARNFEELLKLVGVSKYRKYDLVKLTEELEQRLHRISSSVVDTERQKEWYEVDVKKAKLVEDGLKKIEGMEQKLKDASYLSKLGDASEIPDDFADWINKMAGIKRG